MEILVVDARIGFLDFLPTLATLGARSNARFAGKGAERAPQHSAWHAVAPGCKFQAFFFSHVQLDNLFTKA